MADANSAPLQKIQLTGWLLAVLLITLPLSASDLGSGLLKVCIADGDVPPFTSVNTETSTQLLIRQAAAELGWQVEYVARPWRRCVQEVHSGRLSAIAGIAASDQNLQSLVFPHRGREVDRSRAIGSVRLVVFRPVGSLANWDGQRFSGLNAPVLIVIGSSSMRELLERVGVKSDEAARTPELMARMMLTREHNLAIDIEPRVRHLLAQPEFAGLFDILPEPFAEPFAYLAVSPSTYASHGAQVEQLWAGIGRLRRNQLQP